MRMWSELGVNRPQSPPVISRKELKAANDSNPHKGYLTRSELILKLADRFDQLTFEDTDTCVRIILDAISRQLISGNRVEIRGFGSFTIHLRSPRRARNPRTGERINVPAKAVPFFKPGVQTRQQVNDSLKK